MSNSARALIVAAMVFASCNARADALDEHIRVKPGDGHVSVAAEKTDKGHIRFSITRDASKSRDKARQGWLTISSEAGFVAECAMVAQADQEQITYRFELASGAAEHSNFVLREYRPAKDGEPLQLGGAMVFEIHLTDFVPPAIGSDESPRGVEQSETLSPTTRLKLADGVYPVVPEEDGTSAKSEPIVTLPVVPVAGSERTEPQTIRVTTEPLLRFQGLKQFDFKFENNECTQVSFPNTDELKAYTRDHVGSRLAVVIDNRVITHHKIREPVKSAMVRITCCTVGGGDHLHKHLKKLKGTDSKPIGGMKE